MNSYEVESGMKGGWVVLVRHADGTPTSPWSEFETKTLALSFAAGLLRRAKKSPVVTCEPSPAGVFDDFVESDLEHLKGK